MVGGQAVRLKISDEVRGEIEATMRRTGRDFSTVAAELLTEAVKMRRVPGIVFADAVQGRVPRIEGTGLEVFEVIGSFRELGGSWEQLRRSYDWLSESQLRAALAYAEAYPEEIAERLQRDEAWTQERVWAAYPFMKPRSRG